MVGLSAHLLPQKGENWLIVTPECVLDDLSYGSKYKVEIKCDYCGDPFQREFRRHVDVNDFEKDACRKCLKIRNAEIFIRSILFDGVSDLISKMVDENIHKISAIYYIYESKLNKSYIGSSTDVLYRIKSHIQEIKSKVHYVDYFNNNSNNLEFGIIDFVKDKDEMVDDEYKYIRLFKTNEDEYGFNTMSKHKQKSKRRYVSTDDKYLMYALKSSKLNIGQVENIKYRILDGDKIQDIANDFNVNHNTIKDIKWAKTWINILPELNERMSEVKDELLRRGENNGSSKLNEKQIREIKVLLSEGKMTMIDIGRRFDVSRTLIGHIKRGKLWSYIS